ncbi:hypothetical protein SBRCBS47491_004281 [Sporothrix bragantina]|uniref:Uncharacterized protein n=1 Tax=Sporothrix bragantina TaxID=671064 RepID=A0ABP0BNT3_9PEZI
MASPHLSYAPRPYTAYPPPPEVPSSLRLMSSVPSSSTALPMMGMPQHQFHHHRHNLSTSSAPPSMTDGGKGKEKEVKEEAV